MNESGKVILERLDNLHNEVQRKKEKVLLLLFGEDVEYYGESPRKTDPVTGNIEIYRRSGPTGKEVVSTFSKADYDSSRDNFDRSIIGITTSDGVTIASVSKSGHAHDRMIERGYQLSDVIDALKTATPVPATDGKAYIKGNMAVIVNGQELKTIMKV